MLWSAGTDAAAADNALLSVARQITLGFVLLGVAIFCCFSVARHHALAEEAARGEKAEEKRSFRQELDGAPPSWS